MSGLQQIFSAPFNWCDRRCERCPIASECPVQRRELQMRWVHEARGRDPDDPAVIAEDMHEILASTHRMLLEIAAAEGIDLDEPLPPRPTVLAAKRLERVALDWVRCVARLWTAGDSQASDATAELRRLSTVLATKAMRIASHLDTDADEETWACDGAPNLLLVERLKTQIAGELARLPTDVAVDESMTRAMAELDRNLDPLIRGVGEQARSVLAALEARGAAPSPFIPEAASSVHLRSG